MKRFLIIVLVFCNSLIIAQERRKYLIGINLLPIISNSYEIIVGYEFNNSLLTSVKVGYAGKKGFRYTALVDDMIDYKQLSGFFAKYELTYLLKSNFKISTDLILSQYVNKGIDNGVSPPRPLQTNGLIIGFGIIPGYRLKLIKERLYLDLGVQIGFAQTRNDYLGKSSNNYQPGLGPMEGNPYIQGLCALTIKI